MSDTLLIDTDILIDYCFLVPKLSSGNYSGPQFSDNHLRW